MMVEPHAWTPPVWNPLGSIATYIVRSLPAGIALSLQTSCSDDQSVRQWLASWWESQLDGFRRAEKKHSDSTYAFLYAIVSPIDNGRDVCSPNNWKVTELGKGNYPHAPEDWPERPGSKLAEAAIHDLLADLTN